MNQNKQTHQKITQELQIEEPKNFLIFNDVISSITVDEEFLYITSNENKALLTSLNDFQKESSKSFSIQTNSIISHLRKRQEEGEGLIMTSQGEGNVLVIDPETKKTAKIFVGNILPARFTIDYKDRIYSFSITRDVFCWDFETTNVIEEFKIGDVPSCGALEKESGKIFVGLMNGNVLVLDPELNEVIKVFKAHDDQVFGMTSRDGILYTSGGTEKDCTIKTWDAHTYQNLKQFKGHQGGTYCLKSKWALLFSSGEDYKIKIWDLETTQLLYVVNLNGECWCFDLNEEFIYSASYQSVVRIKIQNELNKYPDSGSFVGFFNNPILCDFKIWDFPVHKFLIKLRCSKEPDKVKKILENNFSKEESFEFLEWIYGKNLNFSSSLKGIEKILDKLEIQSEDFKKKTLQSDLIKAYSDEKSKDFSIIVKNSEQVEKFEEIKVHKFILIAKCGLFRDFFQNINEENSKKVKDYSGKSVESIQHFIKYLYLNDLKLTADNDPELIVEELSDAVDYYQLDENCNLPICLKKIINKFNLN
ncbi:phospholipase a-2-activating protein [Anaeramoeba flamelloides]|uniref:Phospholipase a-2-activating protein n=1 Tax=Anaeramoeba flamelloides TaxID=1746091 RepID=A0AAV7YXB4_9EUKA|nr:phospholipase a-2-activating protein [Anaeramoeba flamelloides]